MGLFDTVRCEYPLPEPAHQDLEYQTNDLESLLELYTITREGRLIRHERPWGGGPGRDLEWPVHGDVRIYESLEATGGRRQWIEYVVRFTDGRVQSVRRAERREGVGPARHVRPSPPPAAAAHDAAAYASLEPTLAGRRLTAEEFVAHTPEKLELLDGRIPGDEALFVLLLASLGLRRAVALVGLEPWARALSAEEED